VPASRSERETEKGQKKRGISNRRGEWHTAQSTQSQLVEEDTRRRGMIHRHKKPEHPFLKEKQPQKRKVAKEYNPAQKEEVRQYGTEEERENRRGRKVRQGRDGNVKGKRALKNTK